MKRLALTFLMIFAAAGIFAQADLQVLAVVKLSKNESITVKQLKTRIDAYTKQLGVKEISLEDRKKVLDAMIQEKLVYQAATKQGITVTDSAVENYFLQSVSQAVGKEMTESQFEQVIKEQTNLSLDEFMKEKTGMSVSEYKAYLKSQLVAQQYILAQRQNELQNVAPTDEDIRSNYELNKVNFVWTDMFKMFLVIVPKGTDGEAARVKADGLYNQLKDKKISTDKIAIDSKKENSGFQAGEVLVNKSQLSAQQLGISYTELLDLFKNEKGYLSSLIEQETNFQFFTIVKKYDAKMLSLSDVIQPETTVTVYDYIKQNLSQQQKMAYLQNAAQEISEALDTDANVERKKTGAELDKLLSW